MAVYTKIEKKTLEALLISFDLGKLIKFEEIQEGVENSNFKLIMTKGNYILTIFEKRVKKKDLPFFIELQIFLNKKNILCPLRLSNKKGIYINKIKGKSCVINKFLYGKQSSNITINNCSQLGKLLALIHLKTRNYKFSRTNTLGHKYWRKLYEKFNKNKKTKYKKIFKYIDKEIDFLEKNWPIKLPSGIIHADAFSDNVFFNKGLFSGIIDFYFSCNDYFAYELAICINAWCFNSKQKLNEKKVSALLNAYKRKRKILKKEKIAMPILLRGAAIRFLLTRLHDRIYHSKKSYVKSKDPMEYFSILNFHKNNNFLQQFKF